MQNIQDVLGRREKLSDIAQGAGLDSKQELEFLLTMSHLTNSIGQEAQRRIEADNAFCEVCGKPHSRTKYIIHEEER